MTTTQSSSTSYISDTFDADASWRRWVPNVRLLWQYRYMLQNLVIRDLKVRYKNSVLGVFWSLVNPLLMVSVFTLVFSVLNPNSNTQPYPIFFLTGQMPWGFFSGSLFAATTAVLANKSLVKKVYFPRELLPLASILSNLVNFFFGLGVLIVFLYAFGLKLTIHALWLPALLFIQILFTLGLSLLLCTLNVFYRDVMMILDVVILAWFFLTPVLYPLEQFNNTFQFLNLTVAPDRVMRWLNPMASIIDGYRTVLWGTTAGTGPATMDPAYLLRTFVIALVMFIVGYGVFNRYQHLFSETI